MNNQTFLPRLLAYLSKYRWYAAGLLVVIVGVILYLAIPGRNSSTTKVGLVSPNSSPTVTVVPGMTATTTETPLPTQSPTPAMTSTSTLTPTPKFTATASPPLALTKPCISYYDTTNGDLKFACELDIKQGWTTETVDSTGDVGLYTSLAFDSLGNPHISYYDNTKHALKYASSDGTKWKIEVVDAGQGQDEVGLYTNLAIDSNNQAYISYYDSAKTSMKLARQVNGKWDIGVIATFTSAVGRKIPYELDSSLLIDPQGAPMVAYYNFDEKHLNLATWKDNKWDIQSIDPAYDSGWYPSLAFDKNGNPGISYYDRKNRLLRYADFDKGKWNILIVDTNKTGRYTSLGYDAKGLPRISYLDDQDDDLRYATWNTVSWYPKVLDRDASVGDYVSMATNSSDFPYISYYDFSLHYLKVAFLTARGWILSYVDKGPGGMGDVGKYTSLKFKVEYAPYPTVTPTPRK
jgi:hypothetical protein